MKKLGGMGNDLLVQAAMLSGKTITTFVQVYDLLLKDLGLDACEI